MIKPAQSVSGLALFGALLLSSGFSAQALTVGRCNVLIDNVYTPALLVQDGETATVHLIGQDGLTRSIVFNPEAAMDWAAALYGSADEVAYSTACHAAAGNPAGPAAPPPPPPPPPDEDDDDDYGGSGNDSPTGGGNDSPTGGGNDSPTGGGNDSPTGGGNDVFLASA